jgi:hypothetical protein
MGRIVTTRGFFASLVGIAVAGALTVLAPAAVPGASDRLEVGSALSAGCDGDGVGTAFTTGFETGIGYAITGVVVSDIDFPSCRGQEVQVVLTDAADRQLGEGGGTVSGSSVTLTIVPAVLASSVNRVHAVIAT